MAAFCIHYLRRVARSSVSLAISSPMDSFTPRFSSHNFSFMLGTTTTLPLPSPSKPSFLYRNFSLSTVKLIISRGKPKFEEEKVEVRKKKEWLPKKEFRKQLMEKKRIRREKNPRNPRRLAVKSKKHKFANLEDRIKNQIELARAREALLVERLKEYEVQKVHGPLVKPHELTGEERFYFRKMAQKGSNYVPVGRRGIISGVILNMHLHWKNHETVKVFCKPCKPGQLKEYVQEIERLSGGVAIQTIGHDTAVFYRGKNYVRPQVMSPIDSLSTKRALEKYKYEQSLASVRYNIATLEEDLELHCRHMALCSAGINNQSYNVVAQNARDDANEAVNHHFPKSERSESCR